MKLAHRMQLRQLCGLAQVSRAGFYRWRKRPAKPVDRNLEVRDAIQRIALEFPCYGSRRIRFALERRGYRVNRKRVQRLMREDNLLCLRRRKFVVTTDSNHKPAGVSEFGSDAGGNPRGSGYSWAGCSPAGPASASP